MTDPKDRGARKFVLTIDGTKGLTIEELTQALSKTAGLLANGRVSISQGFVRAKDGRLIGLYGWSDQ
jgi:hypothetical protein